MNNKISACLVVFNEENVIERCLTSIKDIAEEIIIVHDGECNDNTIEICKKYTENIFIRPHIGEAEPHRPFAFGKAKYEWILSLDADEFLSARLKQDIKNLVKKQDVDAYTFIWPYTDGKKQLSLKFPHRLCLARKSKMFFWGIPHQSMQTTGIIQKTNYIIEHWPQYNNYTIERFLKKIIPWIKLHALYLCKNPEEIISFNTKDFSYIEKIQNSYTKNPLLKIPFRFLKIFILQMYGGQWRSGFKGINIALFSSFYEAILLFYVYKFKRH